jgi:hypothetical protein
VSVSVVIGTAPRDQDHTDIVVGAELYGVKPESHAAAVANAMATAGEIVQKCTSAEPVYAYTEECMTGKGCRRSTE